jgi:hypothetical protein
MSFQLLGYLAFEDRFRTVNFEFAAVGTRHLRE